MYCMYMVRYWLYICCMAATSDSLGVLGMEAMAWLYWVEKVLIISSIMGLLWLMVVGATGSGNEAPEFALEDEAPVDLCLKPSEEVAVGEVFCFCGIEQTKWKVKVEHSSSNLKMSQRWSESLRIFPE